MPRSSSDLGRSDDDARLRMADPLAYLVALILVNFIQNYKGGEFSKEEPYVEGLTYEHRKPEHVIFN